jgi:hypothetical protein
MRFARPTTSWTLMMAVLLGSAVAACDTFTDLRGRVVEESSRPVRGAVVSVRKGSKRVVQRTGVDGRFAFAFTGGWRSPDAVLSACLPGIASSERRFRDGAQARDITISLVRARSAMTARNSVVDTLSCS